MKCPFCRQPNTQVYNSRTTKFDSQIWRRRRCDNCHEVFTTYESPDLSFLKVIRRHGKAVPFSRAQLYADIALALTGTPLTADAITDTVEAKLLDLKIREITTKDIATTVLTTLKHFSTSAFVRYLADQTDLVSNAQLNRELKKY